MFLKSVTELAVDFDDVRTAMLRDPRGWLPALAGAAGDEGDQLLAEVGPRSRGHVVSRLGRLEVGEPMITDRVALLPLRLGVDDDERLFRALEGSLDAAWLGPGRTHLALTASYEPPLGPSVDRALLHRVAEAVAQRFLESVARELGPRRAEV
jgi:hypothetical protein